MTSTAGEIDLRTDAGADVALARRLFKYLGAHKRLFLLALLLYPIDALSVVVPPFLVREILDVAIPQRDLHLLHNLAAVYLGALALEYASGFASLQAMSVLGQRAMRSLRSELFAKVQQLAAAYFDRTPSGRILTRLTNDVEALAEVFATGAITVLGDIITVAAVLAMMFYLDLKLTLFAFMVVPPLVGLVLVFRVYARRAFRAIRKHLARLNTFLAEHIVGMSVVQIFRQEERTAREFEAVNHDYRNANRNAILFDAWLFAVVEAIGTAAVAALIWYGAIDLASGAVGAGTLVAFVHYIRRFFIPIRDLSTKYTLIQSAFAAAERCFQLLDEPVTVVSPALGRRIVRVREGVELKQVHFAYREAPGPAWVLNGVELKVARGEHVALVGPTGSGKTTLLKLLNRTYDPQRGSVCIDGVDLRDYDLADLRRLFAVVLQDVHLFHGTVMDNLALTGRVTPEQIHRAAAAVQADAFVKRLPKGYETLVTAAGLNFSAGERQLLAFARAWALNPEILLLDEATSSVDTETEAHIQAGLDVLLRDRTALIVAHRLSTVRKVDRIVVMQAGHIVEQGSHAALLKRGGLYRKLVELQFDATAHSQS